MTKEKQKKGRRKENMYYFSLERNVEGFSWTNSNYKRALRMIRMIRICRVTMSFVFVLIDRIKKETISIIFIDVVPPYI